jgi:hypothetical protein
MHLRVILLQGHRSRKIYTNFSLLLVESDIIHGTFDLPRTGAEQILVAEEVLRSRDEDPGSWKLSTEMVRVRG